MAQIKLHSWNCFALKHQRNIGCVIRDLRFQKLVLLQVQL
jgi:hypothetical protein